MKKILITAVSLLFLASAADANEREYVWPDGRMPDFQEHQRAAMTIEMSAQDYNPENFRTAYLDWYDAPQTPCKGCMILASGGGYLNCCNDKLVAKWAARFTELGFQCVNFVYRTPRPLGLPIYQSAWEDGQRAVRMVRSEAPRRGFDPERIGMISISAGAHLALLLATSSQTPAYPAVDALDSLPCHLNWAILNAPAYVTTDGENGTRSTKQGYGPGVALSSVFKFDEKTCPMSLHHGGTDPYSPNASTLIYRKLHSMKIPAELHLYPDVGHSAPGLERSVEFMAQMGYMGPLAPKETMMDRFTSDDSLGEYWKEDVWPEGKMPDFQERQEKPYIEWFIPKELKTKAIQIIYSGGGYSRCNPTGAGVTPFRRYLNDKGMAVVVLCYRYPRPEGIAKHVTAWQDLQRAIRIVRSKAASKGLDPDRIGIMGGSAGGHLTLMGVTSSRHQSYNPIDEMDKIPCNVQWGVAMYPAYVLSDGADSTNKNRGTGDEDVIVQDFSFDLDTSAVLFLHGDSDPYSSMNSVKTWEKMRSMGVQSELHTFATGPHVFHREASPGTGRYNVADRIWEFLEQKGFTK